MNRLTNASRRQFLYGAGVAMMLPRLESLAADSAQPAPKRFLGLYVGHGFAITPHGKDDHPSRDWSWYPRVVDGRMKFGKSTAALQPLEQQLSVFYGLDHPGVVGGRVREPAQGPAVPGIEERGGAPEGLVPRAAPETG